MSATLAAMDGHVNRASRRRFMKYAGAIAGGIFTGRSPAGLTALDAPAAAFRASARGRRSHYGEVRPARDQDGNLVLALPEGFRYVTFSRTGEEYGAGLTVPRNHDGMSAFARSGSIVRLIRNHEVRNPAGDFTLGVEVPRGLRYDANGAGGCMTLDFDVKEKRLVRQFASLGGTIVNCSGGLAYGDSGWLTCEESVAGIRNGFEQPHGYAYFVPATAERTVPAVPLKAMGRFVREAAVADARGIIYQTEDAGETSGFYRYTPLKREDPRAGLLQMLAIADAPEAALYSGQSVGVRLPVVWVDIEDPDPALEAGAPSCFAQGRARGGAAFNRLEGIFRGEDGLAIHFVSTSGGTEYGAHGRGYGQLWHYVPGDAGTQTKDELVLVHQSTSASVLESPDNFCITPGGGILFCEDDAIRNEDRHAQAPGVSEVNRLIGLGAHGKPFTFAVNVRSRSEFAGACFSPDGEILFVNLFGDGTYASGMTCAIWGPWERGPL